MTDENATPSRTRTRRTPDPDLDLDLDLGLDLGARLRSSAEQFNKLDKEYKALVTKGKASAEEISYAKQQRIKARDDLTETVKLVKVGSKLVLNTVEQVKAFVGLLKNHFDEDKGQLREVALGNVRNETKRKMWALLEAAGMELVKPDLTFKFKSS